MQRLNPTWTWTGDPMPPDELPPVTPAETNAVRLTTRAPKVFDVYEANGTLDGRVALPPKTRLLRARGQFIWGVQQDSLDVNYAVRFRVEPPFPE